MKPAIMSVCAGVLLLAFSGNGRAGEAEAWAGLTFHAAPRALAAGAKTEDWPRFLGPRDQPVSGETEIAQEFPETGPPLVWECAKGEGYASPAIVGERLVLFHRTGDEERADCLDPLTGKRYWSTAWPVEYRDDFGYSSGPRAGPVIVDGKVYLFGVTSWLRCLDLSTGTVVWQVDAAEKYGVPQYFFGSGSSPLVHGGLVIVNLGGSEERSVVAFDRLTGEEKWIAKSEWGQSYASPVPVRWHDEDRVLVFAGGKSEPSTGGLLCLNPANGEAAGAHFWRALRYPSVNASSPVLCGPDRVFISQAYVDRNSPCNGGVMLSAGPEGKFSEVWKAPAFGCHWMTPAYQDGHLYAFSGEKDKLCELVCYAADTGTLRWKERMQWDYPAPSTAGGSAQTIPMGLYRGSLLRVGRRFLCLGEWGTLCWLDLTPEKPVRGATAQLFVAQQTWTLPALSHGLLYVSQNEPDKLTGKPARLLCYDLRAKESP